MSTALSKGAKVAEAANHPTIDDVNDRVCVVHPAAFVSPDAIVGAPGEWIGHESRFPAIIHERVTIREFARVHAGCDAPTTVGRMSLLMAGCHIGHDATLGESCEIAPNAVICGGATLGLGVRVGANATVLPFVTVGDHARIGAGAVVTRDVPPGETWVGNPAKRLGPRWKQDAS